MLKKAKFKLAILGVVIALTGYHFGQPGLIAIGFQKIGCASGAYQCQELAEGDENG